MRCGGVPDNFFSLALRQYVDLVDAIETLNIGGGPGTSHLAGERK